MARRSSPLSLSREIQSLTDGLQARAADIVADFAHDGERAMEKIIQESITQTGIDRVDTNFGSAGGSRSPGRIDTGTMINAVNSSSDSNGREFVGEFGFTGDWEDYFGYQEDGTATIEGTHAMQTAFIVEREKAIKRINDTMRKL